MDQRRVLSKRLTRFQKLKRRLYTELKHLEEQNQSNFSPTLKLHHKTKHILKNINNETKYLEELNINETYKDITKREHSETD